MLLKHKRTPSAVVGFKAEAPACLDKIEASIWKCPSGHRCNEITCAFCSTQSCMGRDAWGFVDGPHLMQIANQPPADGRCGWVAAAEAHPAQVADRFPVCWQETLIVCTDPLHTSWYSEEALTPCF